MNVLRAAQILLAFGCVSVVLGGCTSAFGPSRSSLVSSPSATGQPSVEAGPASPSEVILDPTPVVSDLPTSIPKPTFSPDPTLTPPPDGLLAVEGGDPIVGELGTWTWKNAGSDAPWLPGYPIHVGVGERLVFTLAEDLPIDSWTVSRVPPSSVPGDDGVVGMGDGTGSLVAVSVPPVGTWSVSVHVRFGDNLGDATYYWAVSVD